MWIYGFEMANEWNLILNISGKHNIQFQNVQFLNPNILPLKTTLYSIQQKIIIRGGGVGGGGGRTSVTWFICWDGKIKGKNWFGEGLCILGLK